MLDLRTIQTEKKNVIVGMKKCPSCIGAREYFNEKGILYEYYEKGENPELEKESEKEFNKIKFPRIFLKGEWVPSYEALLRHI